MFRRKDIGAIVTKDPSHLQPRGSRRERGAPEVTSSLIDEIRGEMRANLTSLRSDFSAIEPRLESFNSSLEESCVLFAYS